MRADSQTRYSDEETAVSAPACRLCLCERTEEAQELVNVCGCRGTLAYVHTQCLALWLRKQGYAAGVWSSPWVLVAAQQVLRAAARRRAETREGHHLSTRLHMDANHDSMAWALGSDAIMGTTHSSAQSRAEGTHRNNQRHECCSRVCLFYSQVVRFVRACLAEWMIILGSPRVLLAPWCPRLALEYWSAQRLRCELCGTTYSGECLEAVIWHWLAIDTPTDIGFGESALETNEFFLTGRRELELADIDTTVREDLVAGEKWSFRSALSPRLASTDARLVFIAVANAAMQMHERLMRRVVRSYRIERRTLSNLSSGGMEFHERLESDNAAAHRHGLETIIEFERQDYSLDSETDDQDLVLVGFSSWSVQIILRSVVVVAFITICVTVLFACGVLSELAFCAVTDESRSTACHEPKLIIAATAPARSVVIGIYALAVTVFMSKLFAVVLCFARAALQRFFQNMHESTLRRFAALPERIVTIT
ncbi:hypothetical protein F1559_001591 [Cyanidiococcus yangmingshanensis]|uniref:RING-CH-type domain-containing protein n=1 Tax=Cyanidiococcus yangmingshanensis TaxID=2690220 RepID=A0A7J7IH55_9RHOD|nr:hypothetical protein F1559_001591 [Cyanidiococcus yangmingshanensis]